MTKVNRVWRLRKRPEGDITDDVLTLDEESIPEPGNGECLFRLNYLSLDPTNRIWMSDMDQYMPPVELDAPMRGVVCGTVIRSRHPNYAEGQIVTGLGTWADYQLGTPASVNPMGDTGPISILDAFSTFTVVGPAAYFGLLDCGEPKSGETVVVSAAAGAVGSSDRSRRSRGAVPLGSPEPRKNAPGLKTTWASMQRSITGPKMSPQRSPQHVHTASTSTLTTWAAESSMRVSS